MNKKNEKGAITLFVIIAGLFFIAFLVAVYMLGSVRRQAQIEATEQVKEIYSQGDANTIYDSYFAQGTMIPIYTPTQLNEMCSGHEVAINEQGGKIFTFSSNAVYVLMNDLSFEYAGIWTMPALSENGRFEGNGKTILVTDTTCNEVYTLNRDNNYNVIYTVSFNANGGSGGQNSDVTVVHGHAMPTISTTAPTKTNYIFNGWYDTPETTGGNLYYDANGISAKIFDLTENLTLYARWSDADTYTIEYDGNGATGGSMASETITYNTAVTIKANAYTKTGYNFIGWTTNSDGTDDGHGWTGWSGTWTYRDGQYGIANRKLKLYARWTDADIYIIEYHGNGATGGSMASDTVTYNTAVSIKACTYTRPGYNFLGWSVLSNNNDDEYGWTGWSGTWTYHNGQYGITDRRLVLYARWARPSYTIEYHGNGATEGNMTPDTVTYNTAASIKANTYTRPGYSFVGWTTYSNGNDDGYGWTGWSGTWRYTDGQYGIADGKLKLYAIWVSNN